MDIGRSKQRIFEILIFINFLLVIPLTVDFIKKFPTEEDQTEQKFLLSV